MRIISSFNTAGSVGDNGIRGRSAILLDLCSEHRRAHKAGNPGSPTPYSN